MNLKRQPGRNSKEESGFVITLYAVLPLLGGAAGWLLVEVASRI